MTEQHAHALSASSSSAPASPHASASQFTARSSAYVAPHFPPSDRPRVWFLTPGDAPIPVSVAQQLLEHGDYIVAGLEPKVLPGREASRAELEQLAQRFPDKPPRSPQVRQGRQGDFISPGRQDAAEEQQDGVAMDINDAPTEQTGDGQEERGQLLLVSLEMSSLSTIQSAYALAVSRYGRIDVLLVANSATVIGCIEELGASPRAQSLLREQFSTNFFGPVNAMKAILGVFRHTPPFDARTKRRQSQPQRSADADAQSNAGPDADNSPGLPTSGTPHGGHIVLLTGITGHLGTPGLGAYCASQWAVEGYCDSLAYEVAPFNVRISIVQSNIEVGVLTNPIAAVPAIAGAYGVGSGSYRHEHGDEHELADEDDAMDTDGSDLVNKAPLARGWLGSLVGRLEDAAPPHEAIPVSERGSQSITAGVRATSIGCPPMLDEFRDALIAETVYAVLSIGGHDNPPARHIVGHEGVTSVKEKLKTVSEELEDFVGASISVDLP